MPTTSKKERERERETHHGPGPRPPYACLASGGHEDPVNLRGGCPLRELQEAPALAPNANG
eukprot:5337911-Lingulodinium_polyedra.AAC.1